MRIAYLDCFAGIAGDMFLGALLQAGVPLSVLEESTAALNLGASLRVETVDRSGISSIKVHVLEGGELAEIKGHQHAHEHSHDLGQPDQEQHQHSHEGHSHQPETQHQHKTGHKHDHTHDHTTESHTHEPGPDHSHDSHGNHAHTHGRSLPVIRDLITRAPLAEPVKALSLRAFELLGRSEAKIHNVSVDEIHFHEVGAVDAIVDIVASAAGIHHLHIGQWYSSAVNVGGGMVECAHGTFPVPAPATADLLRGAPTYSAHIQKELVTPTGAALLRALDPIFGEQPALRTEAIGYGAGTRNPEGFPNVLRLTVGESIESNGSPKANLPGATTSLSSRSVAGVPDTRRLRGGVEAEGSAVPASNSDATQTTSGNQASATHPHHSETVTVLETALDDASPQVLAYVAEKVLAEGALDVMLTPVIMKKGRPGTLMTVLCNPEQGRTFEQLLLRETGTLGVRIRQDRRLCLDRSHATVTTPFGEIRVKVGAENGEERNIAPEFEDCRAAAAQHNVPLKQVQQAALTAFRNKA